MEILGIGMSELVLIFVVALIVMGPKDMQKAGKTVGKWLRNLVTSEGWQTFQRTSRELRSLPNRLMREANEELEQVNQIGKDLSKPLNLNEKKYSPPAGSQPVEPVVISTPEDAPAAHTSTPSEDESDSQPNA